MDPALYRLRVKCKGPEDEPAAAPRFEARDASVVALGDCTMRVYAGDVSASWARRARGRRHAVVGRHGAGNVNCRGERRRRAGRGGRHRRWCCFGATGPSTPPGEACMTVKLAASTKLVVALAIPTTDSARRRVLRLASQPKSRAIYTPRALQRDGRAPRAYGE